MPRFVRSSNTNTDASALAHRAQAKAVYASAVQKQELINKTCQEKPGLGPTPFTGASQVVQAQMGAQLTTVKEQEEIVANARCQ